VNFRTTIKKKKKVKNDRYYDKLMRKQACKEQAEKERTERERIEKEQAERERAEKEQAERERAEQIRAAIERVEKKRSNKNNVIKKKNDKILTARRSKESQNQMRKRYEKEWAAKKRTEMKQAVKKQVDMERAIKTRADTVKAYQEQTDKAQADAKQQKSDAIPVKRRKVHRLLGSKILTKDGTGPSGFVRDLMAVGHIPTIINRDLNACLNIHQKGMYTILGIPLPEYFSRSYVNRDDSKQVKKEEAKPNIVMTDYYKSIQTHLKAPGKHTGDQTTPVVSNGNRTSQRLLRNKKS
jgi:DNA polymerase III alpha subunit (gram-positive type)